MKKKNLTAWEIIEHNFAGIIPKYTIEQFVESNPTAGEKNIWNVEGNTPQFTEEEINN